MPHWTDKLRTLIEKNPTMETSATLEFIADVCAQSAFRWENKDPEQSREFTKVEGVLRKAMESL